VPLFPISAVPIYSFDLWYQWLLMVWKYRPILIFWPLEEWAWGMAFPEIRRRSRITQKRERLAPKGQCNGGKKKPFQTTLLIQLYHFTYSICDTRSYYWVLVKFEISRILTWKVHLVSAPLLDKPLWPTLLSKPSPICPSLIIQDLLRTSDQILYNNKVVQSVEDVFMASATLK
jgi:hypothetical protein